MAAARAFLRAFAFAWDGLAGCAASQRNMRVHLAAGQLACAFAAVAPLSPAERALLVALVAAVLAAEAANTAVEAAVDLVAPGPDARARIAKDSAAGAVLALAAASAASAATIAVGRAGALWQERTALASPALLASAAALAGSVALWRPSLRGGCLLVGLLALGLLGRHLREAAGAAPLAAAAALHLLAWAGAGRRERPSA
jgi:diacylglycerol kinase